MKPGLMLLAAMLASLAGDAAAQAKTIRDCRDCTPMAIISAGSFVMGADRGEPGRPEGPAHKVAVGRAFALAVTEVTNRQWARYLRETRTQIAPGCEVRPTGLAAYADASWSDPAYGRPPRDDEPVVCVSWNETQGFMRWLSEKTGKTYRLPTEAEWEYAARGGTATDFYWGDDAEASCRHANIYDASAKGRFNWASTACNDGFPGVAPVGRYLPNAFGLYDIIGNVWEWTQDCYVMPYPASATTADAIELPAGQTCERRTVRGGSWITRPDRNRVTFRGRDPADTRFFMFGFRVARDLTAAEARLPSR